MATDKFYVIRNNVVENVIVCSEEYAAKNNLIRYPAMTEFGIADINWTFIDNNFLPPPRNILREWAEVRLQRDFLLMASDTAVLPDRWNSYTAEQQEAWTDYRQQLRDITEKYIDPKEIVWPKTPE